MTTGRFVKGQSGNPAGRKPGTGEVARLRVEIAKHVPAIVRKLVALAEAGDVAAARLLLERSVAPLKAADEVTLVTLPDGTLTEQGQALVAAMASGQVLPTQGAAMLVALGTLAKLAEADDLSRRIAALEAKLEATAAAA